jgi:hypothetical protein
VRVGGGLGHCFSSLLHPLLSHPENANTFLLGLELGTNLNLELFQSDLHRHGESQTQGVELVTQLLRILDQVCSYSMATSSAQLPADLVHASMSYLHSCCVARVLTLKSLYSDHVSLFNLVLDGLTRNSTNTATNSTATSNIYIQACTICREIAVMREYPLSATASQALDALASQVQWL